MTTQQLILMTCVYLALLVAVAYFTHATGRRIAGALAGGAGVGLMLLGVIVLGNAAGWWRVPFAPTPTFLPLLYLSGAVSCAPIYLSAILILALAARLVSTLQRVWRPRTL